MELENRVTIKLIDRYGTERFEGDFLEISKDIRHVFSAAINQFHPIDGKYAIQAAFKYPGISVTTFVSGKYEEVVRDLDRLWRSFVLIIKGRGDGVEA